MDKNELNTKLAELNAKMKDLGEKTKDTIDTVKIKGKASAELLKAQMNIDVAKKELAAKKDAYDKASLEAYIEEITDYASACAELSMLAAEEAKLAALEAVAAQQEYEEKYGEEK